MARQNVSGARVTLAPSTVGVTLGARGVGCNTWPAPGAPIPTRLSRPPTNSPARVAQSSDKGVDEAAARGAPRGPRFARFAAAMEAEAASQDQLLPRSQHRIRPAGPVHTSSRIQWLGIVSWALFCAALFVSLLLRPDQDAVDRGIGLQADDTLQRAIVSVPATADPMPPALEWPGDHDQASGASARTRRMDAAWHRWVCSHGWKLLAVAIQIVMFAAAVTIMLAF
jgi:hypothetical protein